MLSALAARGAQQLRFDDVVRNLRNPDPKARLSAVRLLREAKYPEAIAPMAALVNDPLDEIQMEAIAAELSFFLGEEIKSRRMLGFVVERRNPAVADARSISGRRRVPRPVPPELIAALIQAIDDENATRALEAMYALGVIAPPPLPDDQAAGSSRRSTTTIRQSGRRRRASSRGYVTPAGDVLMKAINDSHADVRYAAMRALGVLHEVRARAA